MRRRTVLSGRIGSMGFGADKTGSPEPKSDRATPESLRLAVAIRIMATIRSRIAPAPAVLISRFLLMAAVPRSMVSCAEICYAKALRAEQKSTGLRGLALCGIWGT